MAENNDKPIYISFTIEGKGGFSYTITKLPPLIEGLKCIQRYKVKQHLGPERIIYTDDLLFWERLKGNHYNNFRNETFNYSVSEKDIKKPDFKEYLFALLGEDCLGPKTLLDTSTGNSIYIGALIEGENGHYTVNKKDLVEDIIPYLDEYKDIKDNKDNKRDEREARIKFLAGAVDFMAYHERIIDQKKELQIEQQKNCTNKDDTSAR